MNFTRHEDWLHTWFDRDPKILISGKKGDKWNLPGLLINLLCVKGPTNNMFNILTLETHVDVSADLLNTVDKSNLMKLVHDEFRMKLALVLFSSTAETFWAKKMGNSWAEYDKESLKLFFSEFDENIIDGTSVWKGVNKSINDRFHIWRRNAFTRNAVVNDLDIVDFSNHIFFEMKRVRESVNTWRPYTDDFRNFQLLALLADNLKYREYVICYNFTENKQIALHLVQSASSQEIIGRMAVINVEDIKSNLEQIEMNSYKSDRGRERRW